MTKTLNQFLMKICKANKHLYIINQLWFELYFNNLDFFIVYFYYLSKNNVVKELQFILEKITLSKTSKKNIFSNLT